MLQLAICHLPTYFGQNPDHATIEQYAALLPEEFRSRILSRKHLPSLLQSLGGMLLVRHLLGEEDFDRIASSITHDKNGRPYLPSGELDFNISHSGDWAVCAMESLTDHPRVGVDIEFTASNRHMDQIAKRFFTPNEYDYYSAHYDRLHAFHRIWTRKEALIKWKGEMLGSAVRKLDCMLAPDTDPIVFDEYVIGENYLLTLCHRKGTRAPSQHEILWM